MLSVRVTWQSQGQHNACANKRTTWSQSSNNSSVHVVFLQGWFNDLLPVGWSVWALSCPIFHDPRNNNYTHWEILESLSRSQANSLLSQSFKYGKMQKYVYQPVFDPLAVRSFRVAFLLFRSSAVLSCRRISLILNKYNIVHKELLNYFKDGGWIVFCLTTASSLCYFFIY